MSADEDNKDALKAGRSRLREYLIWLLRTVSWVRRLWKEQGHYLCHTPVEQDKTGTCRIDQICSGELEKGRVGTQLPGEQEAAPYRNLEAAKERETVVAVPSEVLLTQGLACGDYPTLS